MELNLLPVSSCLALLVGCASNVATVTPSSLAPAADPPGHATSEPKAAMQHKLASSSGPSVRAVEKARRAPLGQGPLAESEPPPLPAGTTVLHIGDSFAGALGIPLNKRLKEVGVRGVLKYRTASFIVEWAHQDELETYVSTYQPDLVLISLGANELGIAEPERRIPAIKKIVAKIAGRPCVWVGVPLWNDEHNGLMDIVRDNAAPCRFMDSTALFPDMPRGHDKIHPTMQAREDWAAIVMSWLARQRRPTEGQAWALRTP